MAASVRLASPIWTGRIWLCASGTSRPAARSVALSCRTRRNKSVARSGSRSQMVMAASAAATAEGGSAVVKMKGRARLMSRPASEREPAT